MALSGFRNFSNRHFPRRSVRRGMLAGSLLALLTATGVLSAIHLTAAEPFDENGGTLMPVTAPAAQPVQPAAQPQATSPAVQPATTTPTPANSGRYVALGDSVAAGIGLAPLPNPAGFDTACKRSAQAYGFEVGRQLNLPTELFACSGATSGDLNTPQRIDGTDPPSQLKQAFANGTPKLISITAGANDLRWNELLKVCVATSCGSKSDSDLVDAAIALMKGKYIYALESVRVRSELNNTAVPKVVMTGYYHPVSAACANVPALKGKLTHAELVWINGIVDKVNHHLNALAISSSYKGFARFAPVNFTGHDLCSANSWIQGLTDAQPVHPTAAGQQAIARSVVQAAKR